MCNLNQKIALAGLLVFLSTSVVFAGPPANDPNPNSRPNLGKVNINNYYPSLKGEYFRVQLAPRADLDNTPGTCILGSFYVNHLGALQYCQISNTPPNKTIWGPLPEVWNQDNNDIYLTHLSNFPNLRVGIGTKTPRFRLELAGDGGILAHGLFNDPKGSPMPKLKNAAYLIWYPNKAAFRAGQIKNSPAWDEGNIGPYSAAMGLNSMAKGDSSSVAGGEENSATGDFSSVTGGLDNTASGKWSSVLGGEDNVASGVAANVFGLDNKAEGDYSTIVGGHDNLAREEGTTIIGGGNNRVLTKYSTILGGKENTIEKSNQQVGYSTIGGGFHNRIDADYATITGGIHNEVTANFATVSGGASNKASGVASTVSGGVDNEASGVASIVMGGRENEASGNYSTVSGGWKNKATNTYATVSGGERNTASGFAALIMGGTDNVAAGDYSWAVGKNVKITKDADHSFVWGYSDDRNNPISVDTADVFIIGHLRKSNGAGFINVNSRVGIRDQDPVALLEINQMGFLGDDHLVITSSDTATPGNIFIIKGNQAQHGYIGINKANPTFPLEFGDTTAHLEKTGQWLATSSRKYKQDISPLKLDEARRALQDLQPVSFRYKIAPQTLTLGFVAEDVPELVASKTRKDLTDLDIIAVLTKITQDHEERIEQRSKKIEQLRHEIEILKKQME